MMASAGANVSEDRPDSIASSASVSAVPQSTPLQSAAVLEGGQGGSSGGTAAAVPVVSGLGGRNKRGVQLPFQGANGNNFGSSGSDQSSLGGTNYSSNGKGSPRDGSADDRTAEQNLDWEEWRGDWPLALHAAAGSVAGLMEHLTMYPIDTLKTRIQALSDVPNTGAEVSRTSSNRPFNHLVAASSATASESPPSMLSRTPNPAAQSPLCYTCPLHGHYIRPCPLAVVGPNSSPVDSAPHSSTPSVSAVSTASSPLRHGYTSHDTLPSAEANSVKVPARPRGQLKPSDIAQPFSGRPPGSVGTLGETVRHSARTSVFLPPHRPNAGPYGASLVPHLHVSSWRRANGPASTWSVLDALPVTSSCASHRCALRPNKFPSARPRGASVPVPLSRVPKVSSSSSRTPPLCRPPAVSRDALSPSFAALGFGGGSAPAPFSRERLVARHSRRPFSVAFVALAAKGDVTSGTSPECCFRAPQSSLAHTGSSSCCRVPLSSGQTAGVAGRVSRRVPLGGRLGFTPGAGLVESLSGSRWQAGGCEPTFRAYRCSSTAFSHLDNTTASSRSTAGSRTSLLAAARSLYREGGVRRFYRGASAVASGCVPAHALYFLSYESTKEFFLDRRERLGVAALGVWDGASSNLHRAEEDVTSQTGSRQDGELPEDETELVTQKRASQVPGAAGGPCSPLVDSRTGPGDPETGYGWFALGKGEESGSAELRLGGEEPQLSPVESLICGSAATVTHDVVLTPMDVIKQRLQLGCYRSPLDCLRTVVQQEGIAALCRSLPATMLLNLPYGATLVCVNEWLKQLLQKPHHVDSATESGSGLPLYFFCAAVSGGVAGLISNPLDVIKTRLQTQDCFLQRQEALARERTTVEAYESGRPRIVKSHFFPRVSRKYTSIADAVRTIFREEGPRGFWKGTSTRIALSAPATGICWGSYETVKFLWRRLYAKEELVG